MPLILPTSSESLTRGELRDAIKDFGFDHFELGRLNLVVNQAVSHIHNEGDWPYKEGERIGALPLVIEDLSSVDRVAIAGSEQSLTVRDRKDVQDEHGDVYVVGAPRMVFVDGGHMIRSYPASEIAVVVRYLSTAAWESGGELAYSDDDRTLIPARYNDAIVLLGASYCYGEDAQAESDALAAQASQRIEQMRWQLLSVNRDYPRGMRTGYNAY